MRTLIIIAVLAMCLYVVDAPASQTKDATQAKDVVASVVCGKTESPTPCCLVLDRSVPSYDLLIKDANHEICAFKVERVEGAWKILGETRHEQLIEVIVDIKDGSCTVFNPRRPDLEKDAVPEGHDGLLIRTVEVKP